MNGMNSTWHEAKVVEQPDDHEVVGEHLVKTTPCWPIVLVTRITRHETTGPEGTRVVTEVSEQIRYEPRNMPTP